MKNFNLVENLLDEDVGNVLIIGGECSGKSEALECAARYLIAKTPIFVITNSSYPISIVNEHPDSGYIYKSKTAKLLRENVESIEQDVIFIDGCNNFKELFSAIGIDKRVIMTYDANSIDEIPNTLSKYFKTIVTSKMIDSTTHEKAITSVAHI